MDDERLKQIAGAIARALRLFAGASINSAPYTFRDPRKNLHDRLAARIEKMGDKFELPKPT